MTGTRTVGIPWYAREAYDTIREAMADGDSLPDSYAYWLSSAESVETAVASAGIRVLRIELDLAPFLTWCEANGLAADGKARSRWASEMAARQADE